MPFDLQEILLLAKKASDKIHLIRENRNLMQKLRNAQSKIKRLIAKKEELEGELKRIAKELEASQGQRSPDHPLHEDLPSNLLPYQTLLERKGPTLEILQALEKIGGMKKDGLLGEEEFRTLKQRLILKV